MMSQIVPKVISPPEAITLVNSLIEKCKLPNFREDNKAGMHMLHAHIRFWLCSRRICTEFQLEKKQVEDICNLIYERFLQSIAPAGEPVGALAAQSIG